MDKFFRKLNDILIFIFVAQISLPRAINQHNIRNWEQGGQVSIYQYTPALYTWPLISIGFYTILLDHLKLVPQSILGWTWSITLILVIITFIFDVGRTGIMVTVLLAALFMAVGRVIELEWQIPLRDYLVVVFNSIEMEFPKGIVTLVTASIATVYFMMFLWRRVDSVITIQGDQLTIHRFADEALSYQPGGWMLKAKFADLLEWLLGGGAGSLAIVHPVSGKQLFVANHVPGFHAIAVETRKRFSVTNIDDGGNPSAPRGTLARDSA